MHRASVILLFLAGEALAHPDHGSGGWLSAAISHLLSEPDHLAVVLAPLVVIGLIWGLRRNSTRSTIRD
ncbi:MAG TPA: HupE/UreJ family protein [Burkholderiales bacterium]|jgi:hydrogenase/urease accessory protein HupE|nr:HupE/UreJ family protein [Burkholderiales bacterium]